MRTDGVSPAVLVDSIRRLMAEFDPDLSMRDLTPADARVARANHQLGVQREM